MKRFLQELPKNFQEIGQLVPSSRVLAKRLSRAVDMVDGPRRILEVGAGTGSVTKELLREMEEDDSLVVCEINPRLLEILKEELSENPRYQPLVDRVEFHTMSVQDLAMIFEEQSFDCIVSSLPFTNFTPEIVTEILDLYEWLVKPGGTLSFYEYVGLRKVGQVFRSEEDRVRVRRVHEVLENWKIERALRGEFRSSVTFLNLPPARTLEARYVHRG